MTDKNLSIFECLEADELGVIEKSTTTHPSAIFCFFSVMELIEEVGSGGRDRTANLGVMNPPLR